MEKIYCCAEDYDMAIDDFIMEYETYPLMQVDGEHQCQYCEEPSAYVMIKKSTENLEK